MTSCICLEWEKPAGQIRIMNYNDDDLSYHRQRAADELNRGLSSHSMPVARAHLRLSSLHFERACEIDGGKPPGRPPFQLS
ncbi:MAG TPA: hypothetical protein VM913_03945 [Sphingomicrobium sp.]|jgi:hypothetical protein|nr:hypothetical protein [Sphingomicrobium sp.]